MAGPGHYAQTERLNVGPTRVVPKPRLKQMVARVGRLMENDGRWIKLLVQDLKWVE